MPRHRVKQKTGPPKVPRISKRKCTPSKLNEKLIARVRGVLLAAPGSAYEIIARAFRINPDTFYVWMNKGQDDVKAGQSSTLHARFYLEVEAAKNEGEIELIKEVRKVS